MAREANSAHISRDDAAALRNITQLLSACCADEVHHMNEAAAAAPSPSAAGGTASRAQVPQPRAIPLQDLFALF
jgi:hypothetical protein